MAALLPGTNFQAKHRAIMIFALKHSGTKDFAQEQRLI